MENDPITSNESARLQAFLEENFDFDGLKEMGFWPKGMRRKDYTAQAARICAYFGYQSVYEYAPINIAVASDGLTALVEGVGHVTPAGEYKPGVGGLLTLSQDQVLEFSCPACTCSNELRKASVKQIKCRGCKRTLGVAVDHIGGINVWEK